jgi:hypothetical protein
MNNNGQKFNAKDLCWVAGPNLILLSTGKLVFINILHNIWKEPNTFTPQNPGPGCEVWKPEA